MARDFSEKMRLRVTPPQRVLQGGTVEEQLWVAIRTLKRFTADELAFSASTDKLAVSDEAAERYLQRLREAGYLQVHHDVEGRVTKWVLPPKMNTGPKPPMFVQIALILDRNSKQLVHGPHASEVLL